MLRLFTNALVYAPEPLGEVDVLVAGGRIVRMAPSLPEPPGAYGAERIDCGGRRLIPGFIDAHVHVTGGGGESGPASRVPAITLSALTTAGITSVIGTLGTDGTTRTVAELVARTLGLREEGLSAWCYTGSYEVPPLTLTGSVRRDIVYVDPIIGVGELAISDHRSSQPTLDELLRVAADCHVGGLMSGKAGVLHLHLGDGSRGLELVRRALDGSELPARTFHPTHVNRQRRLFDEALDLGARGVTIDVTAFPAADLCPEELSAADAVERALDAGITVTCSSDGAGCLPVFQDGRVVAMDVGRPAELASSFRDLLARRPLEAILPVFTSNVARQMRLHRKGRLAEGQDADLVLLDDEGRPHDVWALGERLVTAGVATRRGAFEGRESA